MNDIKPSQMKNVMSYDVPYALGRAISFVLFTSVTMLFTKLERSL
jgi:hypothetical protein